MDDHEIQLGPDGSADMVVTFRNIHNWIPAGTAPTVFAVAKVLKPGGVYGVEEHRAVKDLTNKVKSTTPATSPRRR